jgi:hypothetical protein
VPEHLTVSIEPSILLLTTFCLHCFLLASLSFCQYHKNKGTSFILQMPQFVAQEIQHKANWLALQKHRDLCHMFILKMIAISFLFQNWESVQFYFLFIIALHGLVLTQRNSLTFNPQLSPSPPSTLTIFPSSLPVVCYMFCTFTIIYLSFYNLAGPSGRTV